jgi:uncharacterized protein (DUF2062 family)
MQKTRLKDMWAALVMALKEHGDPRGIALGVAIGAFIGILPLYGLHTVLCIAALFLVPRANKAAILLGTNISLPPTVATITWTAYDIGRALLVREHYPPLSWGYIRDFRISKASEFFHPLLVGSVVLGLAVAAVLYLVTWAIAERFRRMHAAKR